MNRFALLLMESLAVKKFAHRDELVTAINALGVRPFKVFKWHEGAQRWVESEVCGL